jgi:predicted nucleic acid-binding protein
VTVVSNTSPITNLAAVGQLNLLQQLYGSIIIPQAVYNEMAGLGYTVPGTIEVQTLPWIQTRQVINCPLVTQLQIEVDEGESEAIALAVELVAERLLIDDYAGRVAASRFGLNVTGILGVLLVAKYRGLIPTVKPVMDNLIAQASFRISKQLYANVLQSAGEQ